MQVQVLLHPTQNGKVIVNYPTRMAEQIITTAEYDLITSALKDRKVNAIKFIRMQYGVGLYEAKQIVDTILAQSL